MLGQENHENSSHYITYNRKKEEKIPRSESTTPDMELRKTRRMIRKRRTALLLTRNDL